MDLCQFFTMQMADKYLKVTKGEHSTLLRARAISKPHLKTARHEENEESKRACVSGGSHLCSILHHCKI